MLETIVQARQLLDDPSHWTKGLLATTDTFYPVHPNNHLARRYCLSGAICKFAPPNQFDAIMDVLSDALSLPHSTVFDFNDDPLTGHKDVLQFLDRVIDTFSTCEGT